MKRRGGTDRHLRPAGRVRKRLRVLVWCRDSRHGLILCRRCELAMHFEDFHLDRIVPGCCGGQYVPDNVRALCPPCNIELGNAARDGLVA